MQRILLVEDERLIISAVGYALRKTGYDVSVARTGTDALLTARRHPPDLIILDIGLPGMDGLQVCAQMRADPDLAHIPILFLTVRGGVQDRVTGLEMGGDDYLPKPFEVSELLARVRALLRRAHRTQPPAQPCPGKLNHGPVTLDLRSALVTSPAGQAQLTPTERDLLAYLMLHPGEVFSADELLQQVWGYAPGTGEPSLVRGYVKKLREKIEADPNAPRFLVNVPRHGYRFTA